MTQFTPKQVRNTNRCEGVYEMLEILYTGLELEYFYNSFTSSRKKRSSIVLVLYILV
jgi:hypothetical protein